MSIIQHHIGDLFTRFSHAYEFDFNYTAIAHVCNCQGVMGSGIALAIKTYYPEAYDAYKKFETVNQGITLGTISVADVFPSKEVYNLHAQEFYGQGGRYLNYEALYICLEQMKCHLSISKIKRVGIPYNMGCDRAGGNWNVVESMINAVFKNSDISFFAMKLK